MITEQWLLNNEPFAHGTFKLCYEMDENSVVLVTPNLYKTESSWLKFLIEAGEISGMELNTKKL